MTGLAQDAVEQAVGSSPKKWALVLIALIGGTMLGVWLHGRSGRETTQATQAPAPEAVPFDPQGEQDLRTTVDASTRRVRSELNRWARLPRAGWDVARNVAGSPRP